MKIKTGDIVKGTYSNGIQSWEISGKVTSIHNDTANGNFATARIKLDKIIGNNREGLLMTLDADYNLIDSKFDI